MSKEKSTHTGPRRKLPEERFWFKVQKGKNKECWLWQGAKQPDGYGTFNVSSSQTVRAHRYAWEITFKKEIPKGICVLHKCDASSCVNPSHLFLGTKKDNTQDMLKKGRYGAKTHPERIARGDRHGARTHPESRPQGEKCSYAKLKEGDVREIRRLYAAGGITQRLLAERYCVHESTVCYIVKHRTWKHIS